jgi:hypothetical protein
MIGFPYKLKADARCINQPLSKIVQKSKKKDCDNEIFSETNKQITQSKLKPFSTNMLLRCCNSIRKINRIIIIIIISTCQRPYAMLKAPIPSITEVEQH